MIQPSGTGSSRFTATISLPSATVDVVTSRITGSAPWTGTPIVIGLVDSRRSVPPNGATRCAPDVLRKCSDTWPAAAANSAQSPTRPRWPQLRRPINAIPHSAAFATPRRVAYSPITWPKPRLPSTIASVGVSTTTVAAVLGRSVPSRTHDTYFATRITPCDSWPTQFASTSRVATACASAGAQPTPRMIASTSSTRSGARSVSMAGRYESPCNDPSRTSVDLRFRRAGRAFEEIEIAAVVRLRDVPLVKRAETACEVRWRRSPRGAPPRELGIVDVELQTPCGDVERDRVAVAHEREWPSDVRFGRDVQYAGAITRSAHPRVRDAQHVAHALLEEPLRDRQLTPFRHAGRAQRARVLQHDHRVGGDGQRRIVDALRHVVVVLEHDGRSAMT